MIQFYQRYLSEGIMVTLSPQFRKTKLNCVDNVDIIKK